MPGRLWFLSPILIVLAAPCTFSQQWELFPDAPHPRLLLPQRRSRMLQREHERSSMRWQQFASHMQQLAAFPEPGFAHSLYYVASRDKEQSELAIQWALDTDDDLRQLALVFDWCQAELTARQSTELVSKIVRQLQRKSGDWDIDSVRDRVFGIIAVTGHVPDVGTAELRAIVDTWWHGRIVKQFEEGGWPLRRRDTYPLLEILHAVRDNTTVDLRTGYRPYFAKYPDYALLSYYPAVYPAGQNDYHIPLIEDASEPDLRDAALTRAADLAMVAYAPNDLPIQFLQGFAMFDQFLMRGTFGIPYEYLWANPYQPGLSYYNSPLLFHDPVSGILIARSSWDGPVEWLYHAPGLLQTFSNGQIVKLTWDQVPDQLVTDEAVVLPVRGEKQFQIHEPEDVKPRTYYLIGLDAHARYDFEVDDEGLAEYVADAGGIVIMQVAPGRTAGVRFHKKMMESASVR